MKKTNLKEILKAQEEEFDNKFGDFGHVNDKFKGVPMPEDIKAWHNKKVIEALDGFISELMNKMVFYPETEEKIAGYYIREENWYEILSRYTPLKKELEMTNTDLREEIWKKEFDERFGNLGEFTEEQIGLIERLALRHIEIKAYIEQLILKEREKAIQEILGGLAIELSAMTMYQTDKSFLNACDMIMQWRKGRLDSLKHPTENVVGTEEER